MKIRVAATDADRSDARGARPRLPRRALGPAVPAASAWPVPRRGRRSSSPRSTARWSGWPRGELREGLGHVSLVYLRPEARGQGGGQDLLQDLATHFREQGVEHVSLNVELPNDEALAYWRRLGFTDYRRSLLTDLESLEQRLAGGEAPSTGSVHVQTDDQAAVEKAVAVWPARRPVGRHGRLGARERLDRRLRRGRQQGARAPSQARLELSYVTGGVVLALGIERGRSCASSRSSAAR